MPLKFALAGNPNSGKTTLFNALTGSTAHVGNWPGVTVERKEGRYRKSEKEILVIDLPGIYSLSPYTPEERIARNYIISERPDVIIDIVDATNLERNLYLTTQLLEMGRPVIVALNMMDIVKKRGDNIDVASIAKVLGVPVVPIAASTGDGVSELMKLAEAAVSTACKPKSVLSATALAEPLEESRLLLPDPNAEDALYHAIKILEQDSEVVYSLDLKGKEAAIAAAIDKVKKLMPDTETESVIADARYKYITKYISSYIVLSDEAKKESF
ncbi:50S ribosome-binding GTPase, partial [Oscillospiraceae bacterium OttesenSCG-928-G22]|nr:50S ribosome-binding GTPase [Oscillospiraceae bacterium OttesenSCG-928-G22]